MIAGRQVALAGPATGDGCDLMLGHIPGIDNGKAAGKYTGQFLSDKVEQELS
ncbi:hypothetical protein D3C78_1730740 [compost metagenome]